MLKAWLLLTTVFKQSDKIRVRKYPMQLFKYWSELLKEFGDEWDQSWDLIANFINSK
jgi:hypothetical protein